MRRLALAFVMVAVFLTGMERAGFAARTLDTDPLPPGDVVELVVFEIEGCTYCSLLRRDVLPAYLLLPSASEVPIRFVDLNDGLAGLKLDSPVDVVPTVVLVRNNRETGRIAGYSGLDNFFQLMRYLLSRPH